MLLDNSYSMRYGTNFDRMKTEADKRIDALGANDRMSLVVFNDNAVVLTRPTSDKNELKAAVATIEPSLAAHDTTRLSCRGSCPAAVQR